MIIKENQSERMQERTILCTLLCNHVFSKITELLCITYPVHGLCIYIIKTPEREVILLRPDDIDLERFFETLFLKEDNKDEVFNKDLLDKMFKSMDTEWDNKVLRVILGLSRSRAEIDKLGIDSYSIIQDRKSVFNFF